MRNVVKGFQFSGMAVPKQHAGRVNSAFTSLHATKAPKPPTGRGMLHNTPKSPIRQAKRPGKNVAIRDGYKV
jgi:hypothetical protein